LSARQFFRQPIRERGEIKGKKRIADCGVLRCSAAQAERQRHVLGDGQRRYQGRELMDHADGERSQRLTGTDARPGDRSDGGVIEPRDQIEQCRRPATRRTQDRNTLPLSNRKGCPFEPDDCGVADPERARKAVSLDDRQHHRRSDHPGAE
jgi:hypothetical protein